MWLVFITASEDIPIAIMFGVVAGLYRDHVPDVVISVIALVGMSLPEFVIGLLLMLVFGVMWAILPAIILCLQTYRLGNYCRIMEVAQPSLIMRGFDYLRARGYVV